MVSSFTVFVTVVVLPAASLAFTVTVLVPSARVIDFEKLPSLDTVTDCSVPLFSLTVTVTGLLVASFVVPSTTQDGLFVISVVGLVTFNVGGTVSITNPALTAVAEFPSLSFAFMVIV